MGSETATFQSQTQQLNLLNNGNNTVMLRYVTGMTLMTSRASLRVWWSVVFPPE